MDKETILKYINHHVFLTLDNGFRYKIFLKQEYVLYDSLSFEGKYGEPIDFMISEISFITFADEDINKTKEGEKDG